jgi:hypothetical protein
MRYNSLQDGRTAWLADRPRFEAAGVFAPEAMAYLPEPFRRDFNLAMDAQPTLATQPNSAIPALLTTFIDPQVYEILFSPSRLAVIFGEVKKGDWLMDTAMFPTVEHTGEVTSYGDYANSGQAGVNTNWPQRQNYIFQTILQVGDREAERAGLARINWVSEIQQAAALVMGKYQNLSYAYGIGGLQNYGAFNDPNLTASLTPATKAAGGVTWFTAAGFPNATANEVYNDIVALFALLVSQSQGLIDQRTKLVLAMSPGSEVAMTFTNSFNVNVNDLLKKNFPNIRIENAVQYGVKSTNNQQGIAGGNLVQLIADNVEGQQSAYAAFSEKMRAGRVIQRLSSWEQKETGGTWGLIIRQPWAVAQMIGV